MLMCITNYGRTNCKSCIEAADKGIWDDFNKIGVDIDAIQITEDREQFRGNVNSVKWLQAVNSYPSVKLHNNWFSLVIVHHPW